MVGLFLLRHPKGHEDPGGKLCGLKLGGKKGGFQFDPLAQQLGTGCVMGFEALADSLSGSRVAEFYPPGVSSLEYRRHVFSLS